MKTKKFPASVRRKMFWSSEVGGTSTCPECDSPLEAEHHGYVMMVRESGDLRPFIVGNKDGHFCPACPTVVLDSEEFKRHVSVVATTRRTEYLVLGLVDFEAIPEDKRDVPLGEDDNPVPLVEFTNLGESGSAPSGKKGRRRKKKRRGKRR